MILKIHSIVIKTVNKNKKSSVFTLKISSIVLLQTILYWNLPSWAESNINYKIDKFCGGCTITDNKSMVNYRFFNVA